MGDVRFEIEEAIAERRDTSVRSPGAFPLRRGLQVAAAIAFIVAVALASWLAGRGSRPAAPRAMTLSIPFADQSARLRSRDAISRFP
jgi:hypothetical protein